MGGKGAAVVVYCGGAKKSSVILEVQGVLQGGFFGTLLLGAVRPSRGAEVSIHNASIEALGALWGVTLG